MIFLFEEKKTSFQIFFRPVTVSFLIFSCSLPSSSFSERQIFWKKWENFFVGREKKCFQKTMKIFQNVSDVITNFFEMEKIRKQRSFWGKIMCCRMHDYCYTCEDISHFGTLAVILSRNSNFHRNEQLSLQTRILIV